MICSMNDREKRPINRNRRALILLLLLAPAFYFFVFRGVRFFKVPSISMQDTLEVGDYLVTLRESKYHRGDVIVFKSEKDSDYMVKRIVGVAGDTINVNTGALYINGRFASEPYITEPMAYEFKHPVTLKSGEFFVLGDNRNWSDDSHVDLEPTPKSNVIGRVVYRYFPFERLGPLRGYPLTNVDGA